MLLIPVLAEELVEWFQNWFLFGRRLRSFGEPLRVGFWLVFEDMACYVMVKSAMFNGVRLPSIAIKDSSAGETRSMRSF